MANAQSPAFKVAGQVIRRRDNRPVRGAHVSLVVPDHPDRRVSCTTGENGEFLFAGLSAGKYSLIVNYRGFSQQFRQDGAYSTAIAVGSGLDSEHVVFPLDSPASIVGAVLDDAGDPVRNATVYLFGESVDNGMRRTGLKATVVSDSDGEFHFAHLQPGTYYGAVSGRPWYAQIPQPAAPGPNQPGPVRPELDVAYPITYYASATTPEAATPITLQEGTRAEIQFNLQPVPALHVSFGGSDKQPDQHVFAAVSTVGPGGVLLNVQTMGNDSGVGGLAPGSYILSPLLTGPNQPIPLGSQSVTLTADSDIDVRAGVKTSIHGKISLEGDLPANLAVALENVSNGNQMSGFVRQDGTFEIAELPPGRYNLRLANTSELYMNSVVMKGATYSKGQLEVVPGAQIQMNIALARGVSKIEGIAVHDGQPVAGAMVLALPQDVSRSNYIPRDQSDSDGTFTLNYAIPGRYTLVAIDDGRGLEYANPAVVAPYLEHGRAITVPLADKAHLAVEVQPRLK